jgi:hypothetical protein
MSDASSKVRGGRIELSPDRPRGLPFLKPLYGLPPYQYFYPESIRVLKDLK